MIISILTIEFRSEQDVVLARQRARQIAELIGFERQDQVRIATAVSELARNAVKYAGRGRATFQCCGGSGQLFTIDISDNGPGIPHLKQILDGEYISSTGMGLGIIGAKRLMDEFRIESVPGKGTVIRLGKKIPSRLAISNQAISEITRKLVHEIPQDPFAEVQVQNQDLMAALSELQTLNRELEETNRGVVALYAELDEKAEFLRRMSDFKTRFFSNMTHEFRTPTNSILSLTDLLLLRLGGELTAEQEEQVRLIRKSAENLSQLVNDLLDLAKLEAGKSVVSPNHFELKDLFGALRGMLRSLIAPGAAVSLKFLEPQEIPSLFTDEAKLSQILRNLISNALKYTPKGEVRVWAEREGEKHVKISVRDTGIGIAPEHQQLIFNEFIQIEGPHQNRKKGTGLGLALSRQLIELLGGYISLQSKMGEGSTFSISLPLVYASHTPELLPEGLQQIDPERLPVLVAEDNPETAQIYERFLRNTLYQPFIANSIAQARAILRRIKPSAILLDILFPNENGWMFLAELREQSRSRDVPVLVVTMLQNQGRAMELGANAFHEKPISRDWLIGELGRLARPRLLDTVLIIDDEEISRSILKQHLAGLPCQIVESAMSGEGLEQARFLRPSIIFLDLALPDMNGFAVLNRLRSDERTRDISVVIYSSHVLTPSEREEVERHGVIVLGKKDVSTQRVQAALVAAGYSIGGKRE